MCNKDNQSVGFQQNTWEIGLCQQASITTKKSPFSFSLFS